MNKTKASQNLEDVYYDWFGLAVSEDILNKILQDEEIYEECDTGGIRDTCQREIAMFALTNLMECSPWPINGDTQEYKDNWYKEFRAKCQQYNIGVNWDD